MQIRPSRNEGSFGNAFMVGKITMNNSASTSLYSTGHFFFFGFSSGADGNRTGTNSLTYLRNAWVVPINNVNPNVWNVYANPTYSPSTLNLSSGVDNWIYLGVFTSSVGGYSSFVYSLDGSEYYYATYTVTGAGSRSAPNICAKFSSATSTEIFYIDSVGLILS